MFFVTNFKPINEPEAERAVVQIIAAKYRSARCCGCKFTNYELI